MRLMRGSGLDSGSGGGGGRSVMGMYISWNEGSMEGGRRGVRRERRKQGCSVGLVGLLGPGLAISAHDTRNMFAE